jgi:hypothetical protein
MDACIESTVLCVLSGSFYFTYSEIQKDSVFTKNIYKETKTLSDPLPQKRNKFLKVLKSLLLGKQIVYRDAGPSVILQDFLGTGMSLSCQADRERTSDLCV